MKIGDQNSRFSGFVTLATFVLVVGVLKVAEEVFIPIALTVMLSFLLTPFVVRLTRFGLPKAVAIMLTVTVVFGVLGGVSWIVFTQTVGLIHQLPDYEGNIRQKISALKSPHGPAATARMETMVKALQRDIETGPVDEGKQVKPNGSAEHPLQVEVRPPRVSPIETVRAFAKPVMAPLGTAAIVIVFVIAMLFQREDLRDRFINVISSGKLNLATQALDDAAHRVNRYLSMQLVVNASYGIPIGLGLFLIGIPNALLWGLLSTLLRFIPFLGPWIAAAFPVALAVAVDPGWSKLGYTIGVYLVMEVVSNNVVEPWLYGASTGISNLALMIAAVFWTWLWGVPGLFLSTPLTVCIMVLGKYLPGLQFLSVLLGSEQVLEPSAKLYQRMLSMDADEMQTIAVHYVQERSLEEFYDDVFMPALLMSEEDRHSGALAEVRQKFIFEASRELIDELERRSDAKNSDTPGDENEIKATKLPISAKDLNEDTFVAPVVFGMPGRDDADEVVALMLQHLLRVRGIETEVMPATSHTDDFVRWIKQNDVRVAFISALPPAALIGARQLLRRVRESCPNTQLVLGVWSNEADYNDLKMRLRRPKPDAIATNLAEAVRQIERLLSPDVAAEPISDNEPADATAPLNAAEVQTVTVPPLKLSEVDREELFSVVTRDLAQHFGVPMSLVTIRTADSEYWNSRVGITLEKSESGETVGSGPSIFPDETLIVEDILKDKRFAGNPLLTQRGVRFYGGVPLQSRDGRVVGALSVVDTKPREMAETDKAFLLLRGSELMEAVETRNPEPTVSTKA